MNYVRASIAALGVASVFFAPAWVPMLAVLLLAIRYRAWEAICIGLITDLMWYSPGAADELVGFPIPFFTLLSIVIVWGLEPLRLEFMR